MNDPSISFLVPTLGRSTLTRCLDSILPQVTTRDEIIVIGDTLEGSLPETEEIVRGAIQVARCRVRYVPYAGQRHDWGHTQLNYGMTLAHGDYIHCQDDDDIWTPEAAHHMRAAAREAPGRPLLFRFVSMYGLIYWNVRGYVQRGAIGGHCLVMPNIPGRLGTFGSDYTGDFDYIESCLGLHGGNQSAVWRMEMVAHARPE